jgi:hypothetical protein
MEPKICPRCKENILDPNEVMNSLSRRANVYICNECGSAEAIEDWMKITPKFTEWLDDVEIEDIEDGS